MANRVRSRDRFATVALAALGGLALAAPAAMGQDFNGDGITDIAIGQPGEDLGAAVDAGAVTIIYGAGPGLGLDAFAGLPAVQINQGAPFPIDAVEAGDMFGAALAWGDFNGDLFDDLAIGAPGESHPISGAPGSGYVFVLFGSPAGLVPMFPPFVGQGPPMSPASFPDPAEPGDALGSALAAGDFNLDGFDDLAVGVPGEDLGAGPIDAGMVNVAYGFPGGLFLGPGLPVIIQATLPWGDPPEPGDAFGSALAAGDMDMNGTDDLAIGVPTEDFAGDVDAGMVNVAYGLPGAGLVPGLPAETWTQDSPCVPDATEPADEFGSALAIADFDGVLGEDLAIGVPFEDIGAAIDAGSVNVIYSAGPPGIGLEGCAPPAPQGAELWHQNSAGVPEVNGAGDMIGAALAAGNFNADPFADLAIGVPGEDVGAAPIVDAGGVTVVYGAGPGFGLDAFFPVPAQFWSQNSAGVPDVAEVGDAAGSSLTTGDFDLTGTFDLAFGVPSEDLGVNVGTGCVMVVYSIPGAGLIAGAPVAPEFWHQNSAGIPDANEPGDAFGAALDNDD